MDNTDKNQLADPIDRSKRQWINLEWAGWEKSTEKTQADQNGSVTFEEPKPPQYSRSPRRHDPIPTDEVKLLQPPQMPAKASVSIIQVLAPVIGIWIGILISIFATRSSNPNAGIPVTAFISAPMVLISAGVGFYNFWNNKRKFEKDKINRVKIYQNYLTEQKHIFDAWKGKQVGSLLADNPPILKDEYSCSELVLSAKSGKGDAAQRLWARSPDESDFLHIRLGTGTLKTAFTVLPPEEPKLVLERDPLIDEGNQVALNYKFIESMPILLPLKSAGSAGFWGRDETKIGSTINPQTREQINSLLIQIATHHAPTEVKIVLVASKNEVSHWDWVKWLPHNWSDDKKHRYFLTDQASRHIVLSEVEALLLQRKNLALEKKNEKEEVSPSPVFVFVFTDSKLWTGSEAGPFGPFLDLLLRDGPALGAFSVFIGSKRVQIPKSCRVIVEIKSVQDGKEVKNFGTLEMVGENQDEIGFIPDLTDSTSSEKFSRNMASVELESIFEAENLPRRATIVDLFGVKHVADIPVNDLWKNSDPTQSLHAPIGFRSGNKIAKVDFQEAGRGDGFGSHGMIGGTTGTGKTQFLQTMILLMCTHYDPEYLNFILIDYKGGDLALGLEELPHLVGSLANVEKMGNQVELIQRLFRSIEVEISRRKNVLRGRNINSYIQVQMNNKGSMIPLAHLFIIIDEFAEMILKNPVDDPDKNLMKRLLSIGAIGRSIGIHLILATQNPGTVVGDDLRNNINTRICLRMGTRDASMQILRRADAYEKIKKDEVGRAYIQVGNNDIFELVQVAWGGASDGIGNDDDDKYEVNLVDNIGTRFPLDQKKNNYKTVTQLSSLVEKIITLAETLNCKKQQQVWLPVLPKEITLETLKTEYRAEINPGKSEILINPMIGLLDDPANRRQDALRIDLSKDGHLLVIGSPGSGKTTLLQTLLSSLVFEHTPDTLSIYILDWGGQNFSFTDVLPHIGGIILSGEGERVKRLMIYLMKMIDERRQLFAENDARTISDYRLTNKPIKDIVIVIDNLTAYIDQYKNQNLAISPIELECLYQLAGDGGPLGIHLVMTSGSVNVPSKIRERISLVAALEIKDNADYIQAVGRTGGLYPARDIPGRGIVRINSVIEFQTALPAEGKNDPERIGALKEKYKQISVEWDLKPKAFYIPPLDKVLLIEKLDADIPEESKDDLGTYPICLGKNLISADLRPLWIDLDWGPHFWVSGPSGSGKTTLLQSILLNLANRYSPDVLKFCIIDTGDSGFSRLEALKHTIYCAKEMADFKEKRIEQFIMDAGLSNSGNNNNTTPHIIVAIDDLLYIKNSWQEKDHHAENPAFLQSVLQNSKENFIHVIAAGNPTDFSNGFPFADQIKKNKTGFLVCTNDNSHLVGFNVKYGADVSKQIQVGWSHFFRRGVPSLFQIATIPFEKNSLSNSIKAINSKWYSFQ